MLRKLRWLFLALFLVLVGIWPAVAAPVTLAATGAGVILAAIPVPVLALAAFATWLHHRHATA
ncbi:hypothetical protein ACFC08_17805 [Streptomyces sp. NPDC056112]|uniref:hypothetical protein n=1 Tax=Streptomyces sp. NPDC056112 TaxID=3345715 RepID=UPI0035E09C87